MLDKIDFIFLSNLVKAHLLILCDRRSWMTQLSLTTTLSPFILILAIVLQVVPHGKPMLDSFKGQRSDQDTMESLLSLLN